jgi:hypothetical protein
LTDGHREEYYNPIDQRFLGEERFVEKLKALPEEEVEARRPNKTVNAAFRIAA